MRHLETLSEHVMVAAFLKGEIASPRFGPAIVAALEARRLDRRVVDEPDVSDAAANAQRLDLLGELRGYRRDRKLFRSFPGDVSWHRYALTAEELGRVKYIDYSYWNALSGGSRLPADSARNIRAGLEPFGQPSQPFWAAAEALVRGATFPELILVGTDPNSGLVVLEGHLRLTAYFLQPNSVPAKLTALVGLSPRLNRWMSPQ